MRLLSRIKTALNYRSLRLFYISGTSRAKASLYLHKKYIRIRDRPCCEANLFRLTFRERNLNQFSQLNFAATSDLIIAPSLFRQEYRGICETCKGRTYENSHNFIFTIVDDFRSELNLISLLRDLPGKKSMIIAFGESKNFHIQEISKEILKCVDAIYVDNAVGSIAKVHNLYPLPLGFRDGKETDPRNYPMSERTSSTILSDSLPVRKANSKVFAEFSPWTNAERSELMLIVNRHPSHFFQMKKKKLKPYKLPTGDITPQSYLLEMSKFRFVLCPRGAGDDTHRFYEALALNAIPIVRRQDLLVDKIYSLFPCIVINHWDEIVTLKLDEELFLSGMLQLSQFLKDFPLMKIHAKDLTKLFKRKHSSLL